MVSGGRAARKRGKLQQVNATLSYDIEVITRPAQTCRLVSDRIFHCNRRFRAHRGFQAELANPTETLLFKSHIRESRGTCNARPLEYHVQVDRVQQCKDGLESVFRHLVASNI